MWQQNFLCLFYVKAWLVVANAVKIPKTLLLHDRGNFFACYFFKQIHQQLFFWPPNDKKGRTAMVTFSNEFHKWLWSNISKTLPFLTSCQEENVLVGTRENFITKSCFWKIHLWLACLHSSQKILNQKEKFS